MDKKISKSLIKLCEENAASYITGSEAVKKIQVFLHKDGVTRNDIHSAFLHPSQTFGAFDELPKKFRESLAHSAQFHIQEMSLLTTPITRTLAYGPIFRLGGYLVHLGLKIMGDSSESVLPAISQFGRRLIRVCRNLCRILLKMTRFTRFYQAPFPHMLWNYVKVDPWSLIQDYIQHVPVDPRLGTVYKSTGQGATSCGLIGIDFLPSQGKLYFLESNFNPGHYFDRHLLFSEGDTVCNHLVDWAAEKGYPKIVFFPHNFQVTFEKEMEEAWRNIAQKKGITLEIVDDPYNGSPWPRSRRVLMDCEISGVLYVNGRHLPGPLSHMIAKKGLLDWEIRRFNHGVQDSEKIAIPRIIIGDQDVPAVGDESLFPNIIIKNANLDQTKGIFLYKSNHLPAGANDWPNIAYEYVIPDLVVKETQGEISKYVYIFRAYLLLTPDGPVYLGARKDVSSVAVPSHLPFGAIQDKSPYITNLYVGAYSVPHSEAENQLCRDAVLALGSVVFRFIREKHILTFSEAQTLQFSRQTRQER